MKPYVFLLGILAIVSPSQAQKIRFSDTSNKWTQIYLDWTSGVPAEYSYSAGSSYGTDTVIAGQTYHQLSTQSSGGALLEIAIREDTIQGKVFFREMGNVFPPDTSEHVLYDYTLRIGDTLKFNFSSQHFGLIVQGIDSVQMGGEYYRRWKVFPYKSLLPVRYLIEGIGSTYGPNIVSLAYSFESSFMLSCFTSKGVRLRCTPSTPFDTAIRLTPSFFQQPIPPHYFDNDTSCDLKYLPSVGITGITADIKPYIVPNPGGQDGVLICPTSLGEFAVVICDVVGKRVVSIAHCSEKILPVGKMLDQPGTYFYSLKRLSNGERMSGRFVFQ